MNRTTRRAGDEATQRVGRTVPATVGQGWVDLCAVADVPGAGGLPVAAPSGCGGLYVVHDNRALAVFRVVGPDGGEVIRVTDDTCPHAGGSLSAGHLDTAAADESGAVCVVCPWHAWAFDLASGACPDNTAIRVRTYGVQVKDGRVWVNAQGASRQVRP